MRAIRGIDVHLHQSGAPASELEIDPLGAVGGPHADAVAGDQPEAGQSARGALHFVMKLAPGEADTLMPHHQRFAIRESAYRVSKNLVSRLRGQLEFGSADVTVHER